MLGQRLVQERVVGGDDLPNGSALTDDVLEERDRLVIHRLLHRVGELRKAFGVHAAVLVKAVEAEPLAEELGRKACAPWGLPTCA